MDLEVPGWRTFHLAHLVLDVNGTLSLDGSLLPGVAESIAALGSHLRIHLLSADTFGQLDQLAADLGVPGTRLRGSGEAEQKAAFVRSLDPSVVVAIGNGANDVGMLREAGLAIAVLGPEGLSADAAREADVLVGSISDGLGLLLHPRRLAATLRR